MTLRLPSHPTHGREFVQRPALLHYIERTLQAGEANGMVVWSGPSRVGKTSTATHVVRVLAEQAAADPAGRCALHYQCVADRTTSTKGMLRRLHDALITRLPDRAFRNHTIESLLDLLAEHLRQRRVGLLFLDEAGQLAADDINTLVALRDRMQNAGYLLQLVFVGMDDLPEKMRSRPQIAGRIADWICFAPCEVEDLHALVDALAPGWSTNLMEEQRLAALRALHKESGGVPGRIELLLGQARYWQRLLDDQTLTSAIETAAAMTRRGEDLANAQQRGHSATGGSP